MTAQQMLEIQRYISKTRPELRAGSQAWWIAVRAEVNRRGYR